MYFPITIAHRLPDAQKTPLHPEEEVDRALALAASSAGTHPLQTDPPVPSHSNPFSPPQTCQANHERAVTETKRMSRARSPALQKAQHGQLHPQTSSGTRSLQSLSLTRGESARQTMSIPPSPHPQTTEACTSQAPERRGWWRPAETQSNPGQETRVGNSHRQNHFGGVPRHPMTSPTN